MRRLKLATTEDELTSFRVDAIRTGDVWWLIDLLRRELQRCSKDKTGARRHRTPASG
jgi:hypothetical protein